MEPCSIVTDARNLFVQSLDDTSNTREIAGEMDRILTESSGHLREREAREKFDLTVRELFDECSDDDWDGYGSKACIPSSLRKSIEFFSNLLGLGLNIGAPHIVVEANGHVMFTWQRERNIVSAIVQDNGWLIFSSIIGAERLSGVDQFINGKIPPALVDKLTELCVVPHDTSEASYR